MLKSEVRCTRRRITESVDADVAMSTSVCVGNLGSKGAAHVSITEVEASLFSVISLEVSLVQT
ncbi:MAG TPA: hypothetical protein VGC12_03995 [Methyloradius sp.]